MDIYLDHAATTYVAPEVKKEMERYFSEDFGNPLSLHSIGQEARNAVEQARSEVANALGAPVSLLIGPVPFQIVINGISDSEKGRVLGYFDVFKHVFVIGCPLACLFVGQHIDPVRFLVVIGRADPLYIVFAIKETTSKPGACVFVLAVANTKTRVYLFPVG